MLIDVKLMAGLRSRATEFWASSWTLIYRLDGYICSERHKAVGGTYQGQDRCDYVKVWPKRLCELLVAGVEELRRLPRQAYLDASDFKPVPAQVHVCMKTQKATGGFSAT